MSLFPAQNAQEAAWQRQNYGGGMNQLWQRPQWQLPFFGGRMSPRGGGWQGRITDGRVPGSWGQPQQMPQQGGVIGMMQQAVSQQRPYGGGFMGGYTGPGSRATGGVMAGANVGMGGGSPGNMNALMQRFRGGMQQPTQYGGRAPGSWGRSMQMPQRQAPQQQPPRPMGKPRGNSGRMY